MFYVYCVGFFGLNVVIELNIFRNNMDKVMILFDNNNCGVNYKSNFVNVKIDNNIFMNNCVENVLYIDYSLFFEMWYVIVRNNIFEDNEVVLKDLFLIFFCWFIICVVIVFKEGIFNLYENILENFSFVF